MIRSTALADKLAQTLSSASVDTLLKALQKCKDANKPRAASWVVAELKKRGVTVQQP